MTTFRITAGSREAFRGVDACLFCLGISASQVSGEAEYRKITYDFALAAAAALKEESPAAAFQFLSGQGAGLQSRMMWARVKAEAERDLIALVDAVCWRPGFIDGETSSSGPRIYQAVRPLFRLFQGIPEPVRDGGGHRPRHAPGDGRGDARADHRQCRDPPHRCSLVC